MRLKRTNLSWSVIALAAICTGLRAQDANDALIEARIAREKLLTANLSQVRAVISLDRATPYFPGEAATVTVTMTNPTSTPLEIPDPRVPEGPSFEYSRQGGPGTKDKSEWPPFSGSRPWDLNPTFVMQPGQSISMTFPSDQCGHPCQAFDTMPMSPGSYRMRFRIGRDNEGLRNDIDSSEAHGWAIGDAIEFQVAAPELEAWTLVPLQEFSTFQDKGVEKPETLQSATMIVAVLINGEHLVMAAQHKTITTDKILERDKEDNRWAYGGEPWVRLATLHSKVTKLSGEADPTGRITLEYTTEDGGGSRVHLDENRHPL